MIQRALKENQRWSDPPLHFVLMPTLRLLKETSKVLFERTGSGPSYDCDQRPEKAEAVARQMLIDWRIAREQAEKHGAEFLAVLQPTAYGSKSKLDHLELDPVWAKQYETVYPTIISLLVSAYSTMNSPISKTSSSIFARPRTRTITSSSTDAI